MFTAYFHKQFKKDIKNCKKRIKENDPTPTVKEKTIA